MTIIISSSYSLPINLTKKEVQISQAQTTEKSVEQLKSEVLKKKKNYDLTVKISEKTVVYPGDPEFKSEDVCSFVNQSKI